MLNQTAVGLDAIEVMVIKAIVQNEVLFHDMLLHHESMESWYHSSRLSARSIEAIGKLLPNWVSSQELDNFCLALVGDHSVFFSVPYALVTGRMVLAYPKQKRFYAVAHCVDVMDLDVEYIQTYMLACEAGKGWVKMPGSLKTIKNIQPRGENAFPVVPAKALGFCENPRTHKIILVLIKKVLCWVLNSPTYPDRVIPKFPAEIEDALTTPVNYENFSPTDVVTELTRLLQLVTRHTPNVVVEKPQQPQLYVNVKNLRESLEHLVL